MLRFHTVLFDLDGTLIDTSDLIVITFQHVLREELGIQVSPEELIPYIGEPLRTTIARFVAPARVDAVVSAYRRYNQARHDELARPVPGMRDAVRALYGLGIRLAVTTSKLTAGAERGLRLFGLDPFFSAVVGVDQTERHKPDPEPVLVTLSRLGVQPGPGVLMVGDSPYDLESGRRAGVRTAAVGWTRHDPEELRARAPDHWINDPQELVSLCAGGGTEPETKPS